MSLLRFLSVGRAFNQGKGGLGRYRLPKHGGLPKFNVNREPGFKSTAVRTGVTAADPVNARNKVELKKSAAGSAKPFKAAAELRNERTARKPVSRDPAEAARVDTEQPSGVTDQRFVPRETAKPVKADTVRLPSSTQPLPRDHRSAEAGSKRQREWSWARRLNPFGGRTAREEVKPAEAVQREFSLDEVKPVRNDLTDSDLELVSVVQPAPEKQTAAEVEPENEPGKETEKETLWGRLSDKLFDAGRTP